MSPRELTKTFMMILNCENTLVSVVYTKIIQRFKFVGNIFRHLKLEVS